ncbi:MAG: glycosyltransferase family 2 protein [Planctomycetes bacterium]|nr:glycosyltransferase family 2 protein [Planctomycetota bacterium]
MADAELILMPLNYKGRDLLEGCLPSVLAAAGKSPLKTEVWVIDNASDDGSEELVRDGFPSVRFVKLEQNLCLQAYNCVLAEASCPYVLLLNNDIRPEGDFITPLLRRLESSPEALGVSPAITADQENERYPVRRGGRFFHGHLAPVPLAPGAGACLYLHGAAMLVRREKFLALGGFDPIFFYMEDNDLSYRAWMRGWSSLFEPSASAFHLAGVTTARVHGGSESKRALKEKASNLFVIKNISDPLFLADFLFWSFLKILKMMVLFDRYRLRAFRETLKLLPLALKGRPKGRLQSDRQILRALMKHELPPLPTD